MASTILTPNNSDITANWDTATGGGHTLHYERVMEGTDSYDDLDYIETTTTNDDDRFEFTNMPPNTNLISAIDLKVRCGITDNTNAAYIECSLYHSGNPGTLIGTAQNIVIGGGANDVANDGTLKTVTKTWGGLSLTKTQVDGLQVKFVFKTS